MRTLKLLVGTGLALASVITMAGPTPGTGIEGTRHDWSAPVTGGGTGGGQSLLVWCPAGGCVSTTLQTTGPLTGMPSDATTYKNGTTQVAYTGAGTTPVSVRVQFGLCTKCHTPHQARSTNLLWNHTLLATNYKWDVTHTTAGTNYPSFLGDTYKGPSTKCLSCHDGTLASTDGVWFKRQRVSGAKHVSSGPDSGHNVAATSGSLAGSHPVAFPYPLNGAPNTYNGATTGAQLVKEEFAPDPTGDGIRLFNELDGSITAGKVAGSTGMECTSCHDVHNGKRVVDQQLLTGSIDGGVADGYICTKCHKK